MLSSAVDELVQESECCHGNTEPQVNQCDFLESDQDVVDVTLLSLFSVLSLK